MRRRAGLGLPYLLSIEKGGIRMVLVRKKVHVVKEDNIKNVMRYLMRLVKNSYDIDEAIDRVERWSKNQRKNRYIVKINILRYRESDDPLLSIIPIPQAVAYKVKITDRIITIGKGQSYAVLLIKEGKVDSNCKEETGQA